jgi:hypothetical protein
MRYIIAIFVFIGLAITIIVLLVRGTTNTKAAIVSRPVSLSDKYQSGLSIVNTTDGIINNDIIHRSMTIKIDINNINLTTYRGYDGVVLNSYNFKNNPTEFKNFLASISLLGYRVKLHSKYSSSLGLCPFGNRSTWQIINGPSNINQNLWSTTCGQGSEGGQIGPMQQLIQNQFPNYSNLVTNFNLNLTSPPTN